MRKGSNTITPSPPRKASMGPQHESCGKQQTARKGLGLEAASMGPQHESCGKPTSGTPSCSPRRPLQWGRNMRVAESRGGPNVHVAGDAASMGPQHESCGKFPEDDPSKQEEELQWGRNMRVAERPAGVPWAPGGTWLQWGRNMRVAESNPPAPCVDGKDHASMGPQHESCGKPAPQEPAAPKGSFNGAAT